MRRMIFTMVLVLGCTGDFKPDLSDVEDGASEPDDGGSEADDGGTDVPTEDDGGTDVPTEDDGGSTDDTTPTDPCGNGVADPGEECDGLDLRGMNCTGLVSPGAGNYHGGELACTEDCTRDTTSCTYCGDDTKNGPEECDGLDLGGDTCEDHGFDGGDLTCSVQCSFVLGACENCEGDSTGMYGSQGDVECGGIMGSQYSICLPTCTTDADCEDLDLAICPVQPTCNGTHCYIVCSSDDDCPGGMFCVGDPHDYCAWEF